MEGIHWSGELNVQGSKVVEDMVSVVILEIDIAGSSYRKDSPNFISEYSTKIEHHSTIGGMVIDGSIVVHYDVGHILGRSKARYFRSTTGEQIEMTNGSSSAANSRIGSFPIESSRDIHLAEYSSDIQIPASQIQVGQYSRITEIQHSSSNGNQFGGCKVHVEYSSSSELLELLWHKCSVDIGSSPNKYYPISMGNVGRGLKVVSPRYPSYLSASCNVVESAIVGSIVS